MYSKSSQAQILIIHHLLYVFVPLQISRQMLKRFLFHSWKVTSTQIFQKLWFKLNFVYGTQMLRYHKIFQDITKYLSKYSITWFHVFRLHNTNMLSCQINTRNMIVLYFGFEPAWFSHQLFHIFLRYINENPHRI